eukprot:Nitzschia sp. Nitz4//scaffold242_size29646//26280//28175//NITZ4_008054-RA/size29646-processed-gene-0.55-mRNA-1//1//CDS//3329543824//4163//frame0
MSSSKPSKLFLLLLSCLTLEVSHACTVFLVGKDATVDGSVLVTHSNDGEFDTDPRLVKVPAQEFSPNASRPIFFSPETYPRYVGTDRQVAEYYPKEDSENPAEKKAFEPIGYIPQVSRTFAYLEETYGAVNEHQVGIGESTCSAVFGAIPLGAPNGTALFSIDELTKIAMERATTARQAVQLMGDLAFQHGFYGAGEFEGTGESLAVSDPNDLWIFHILPDPTGKSAIWAAQRLPSNAFAVLANMFVIREVDPTDKDNFLMSPTVHSVAEEYGWWSEKDGTLLDFTKVYSDGEYAHKYYSGRRMWGAFQLAMGQDGSTTFPDTYADLQSDPVYPVYVVPESPLALQDIFRFHRNTYEGTKYDLGAPGNLAGGPFGTPDRWKAGQGEEIVKGNWERAIGLYRTSDTYVVQSFQSEVRDTAVLWFGPASALATVFTPFTVTLPDIPASFRSGHQAVFSRSSAFWGSCVLHNIANLKWSYMIQDIRALQNELESNSLALIENYFGQSNEETSLEQLLLENADNITSALWSFSDHLLFRYASGFVNDLPPGEFSQMKGYPAWWLQAVGYPDGPPPPPTVPKCCDPPKPETSRPHSAMVSPTHLRAVKDPAQNSIWLTGKAAMRQFERLQEQQLQS